MAIEIGGTAAGQFGRITINGAAHSTSLRAPAALAGTLNLSAVNGFDPAFGSSFNVMTYTSHTGQFDTVNGTALGNGKQFSPAYSATNLALNVTAPSTPAQDTRAAPIPALPDSDGDGIPDAQELLAPSTVAQGTRGTDPSDAASTLHLVVTRTSDSNVELQFASVVGRTYAVECCTDLQGGVWLTLRDNIPGTGAPIPFIDESAASRGAQCFYRLRVWRP